jgi:hypothetical protein
MDLINKARLADKRPATVDLPLSDKTRSRTEGDLMEFGLGQLFERIDMVYSETRPDRVSEVGCTWRGNLFPWERDIDVRVKTWQCDLCPDMDRPEFQIACKGSGYWYILLRRAVKETGTPCGYQPKALESLFRILTSIGIRSMLNEIQGICETDDFRQLLFCSAKSVKAWVKSKHTYDRSAELLNLFEREHLRFQRYFWRFFKVVFPREAAILRAAETRLRAELAALGNPKIDAKTVAEGFSICLADAKAKDGYTDDRAVLAARYRELRFDSKIQKQVLDKLPSWFRATPITEPKAKRDRKGRFVRNRR